MVGYSGWNAATYVAEELRRPERTLPAALAVGTALVTALFIGLNIVFHILDAARSNEGRAGGRIARRLQSVRSAGGRHLLGADGDLI